MSISFWVLLEDKVGFNCMWWAEESALSCCVYTCEVLPDTATFLGITVLCCPCSLIAGWVKRSWRIQVLVSGGVSVCCYSVVENVMKTERRAWRSQLNVRNKELNHITLTGALFYSVLLTRLMGEHGANASFPHWSKGSRSTQSRYSHHRSSGIHPVREGLDLTSLDTTE